MTRACANAGAAIALVTIMVWQIGRPAQADSHDDAFDMATITCWELTGVEAEERLPALMMLYGCVAGVHGLNVQRGSDIEPALQRVGRLCSANPDMYVVDAIRRFASAKPD